MEDRAEQKGSRTTSTRQRVAELLARGHTVTDIARRLNRSKPTICHHARRLGGAPSAKYNRRYDWAEVQRHYDAGHTVRECALREVRAG